MQGSPSPSSSSSPGQRSCSTRSLLSHYRQPNREKTVAFGMIEIFQFPVTVGDNPHVSSGCPIAMDPESASRTIQPLDAYERQRLLQQNKTDNGSASTTSIGGAKKRKKTRDQLKISVSDRARL
jgi:hypothetical protein